MNSYWLSRTGSSEPEGPFTLGRLQEMQRVGQLGKKSLVCLYGCDQWEEAEGIVKNLDSDIEDSRTEHVWEYCNSVSNEGPYKRLTKEDARILIKWLDVHQRGWDDTGDGSALRTWQEADCCRRAWECIPFVFPDKVKVRSRLDLAAAREELSQLRAFHQGLNRLSRRSRKGESRVMRRGAGGLIRAFIFDSLLKNGWFVGIAGSLVIMCSVVFGLMILAPVKGLPPSVKKLEKLSLSDQRRQKAKEVIAEQVGSMGTVRYLSFKEFQIGAGQLLVVTFELMERGGVRAENIWTFSFDRHSGDVFNINKAQQ